jgi:hypothetical protein
MGGKREEQSFTSLNNLSEDSLPKREDKGVFSLSDQYFPTKEGRYGCIFPVMISIFPMRQGNYQYFPYETGKILVYSPQEQVFDRQIVYFKHGIYYLFGSIWQYSMSRNGSIVR